MSIKTFLIVPLIAGAFCSSAQFLSDYHPLEASQVVPQSYIVNVPQEAESLAKKTSLLKEPEAKKYYAQVLAVKKMIIESGDVYLPNSLTLYVDSIAKALLDSEPQLKESVKIYLSRYSSANAFCLSDGSVFLNLGLLNKMESESELAFVIAHEIAHFNFQHNLKDYLKADAIQKMETYSGGVSDRYRKLRFSRESEQEADSYALHLMNTAGFDPAKAISALEKLKESVEKPLIDYKSLFNNSFFTFDTILVTNEMIVKVRENLKNNNQDSPDSKVDDLYDTHPDLDKRIGSTRELLRNIVPGKLNRKIGNYSWHQKISEFELCDNYYRDQDYINTILQSARLLGSYPDNNFLLTNMAASLYWISFYKELSNGELRIFGDLGNDPLNFSLMYLLFNKMKLKDCKQLAYAFLRSREDKITQLEAPFFYLALNTENYLGKIAARDFYTRYEAQFPKGNQIAYVKSKLK